MSDPSEPDEPETQIGHQSADERRHAETVGLDRDQVKKFMEQAQEGTIPKVPPAPAPVRSTTTDDEGDRSQLVLAGIVALVVFVVILVVAFAI